MLVAPWTDSAGHLSALKAAIFAGTFVPAIWLIADYYSGALGPRPLNAAIHLSGLWAVRFLLLSLAVTPLRRIADWSKLVLVRRMLGLAALAYALLHLTLYAADQGWSPVRIASEILLRYYLAIGFVALLGLIVLGLTSTDAAIRRLGKAWTRLHKLTYPIAILSIVHFFMQSKIDVWEAALMAGLFLLLMIYRVAQARGLGLGPIVLVSAACLAGLFTAAVETAWFGAASGVPAARVLAANLDFSYQIRPAWWVLAVGLCVAAVGALRGKRLAGGRMPRARATG